MPIVTPGLTKPASTQSDLGSLIGQIGLWRPDIGSETIKSMINDSYRRIIDSRNWYGLLLHGEVVAPSVYTTGTVTTVSDSDFVNGVGTAWDSTMVGRQFRVGFTLPAYTIKAVSSATQIQLDLPWGGGPLTNVGYQLLQAYYVFGPKVKRLLVVINKQQGYRLDLNWSQEQVNTIDPWRTRVGWTFAVVDYIPDTNGQPQFELYPWPTVRQAFPFLAYSQPADLVDDADSPVTFVRSDVLFLGALTDALRFRKGSQYYDPDTAEKKERQFQQEIQKMARADNDLYQKDHQWEYWRQSVGGSEWIQAHAVPAEDAYGWGSQW